MYESSCNAQLAPMQVPTVLVEELLGRYCNCEYTEADGSSQSIMFRYAVDLGQQLYKYPDRNDDAAKDVLLKIANDWGLGGDSEANKQLILQGLLLGSEYTTYDNIETNQKTLPKDYLTIGEGQNELLLYYWSDGRLNGNFTLIGNHIELVALLNGESSGKEFSFYDVDGNEKNLIIRGKYTSNVIDNLRNNGWHENGESNVTSLLNQYLISSFSKNSRKTLVTNTGWSDDFSFFALPDLPFKSPDANDICFVKEEQENPYQEGGSLSRWQETIGTWARGNTRMTFALSLGLTGPFLKLAPLDNSIVTLLGPTSSGKTTILRAAASLWGKGSMDGFIYAWEATKNGLESRAALHNGTLLCLDEMTSADANVLMDSIYMLANGTGKITARSNRSANVVKNWKSIVISTGEIDLTRKASETKARVKGGQLVRYVEITPPSPESMFETAHDFSNCGELANAISDKAQSEYGWAGPAFVKQLVEHKDEVRELWESEAKRLSSTFYAGNDSKVQRVLQNVFVPAAFLGEQAAKWGVFPWEPGMAECAAKACFDAWFAKYSYREPTMEEEIVKSVTSYLARYKDTKFQGVGNPKTDYCVGYRKRIGNVTEYYFEKDDFQDLFCTDYDLKDVRKSLKQAGLLTGGVNLTSSQKKVQLYRGCTRNCYALKLPDGILDSAAPSNFDDALRGVN